MSVLFMLIFLFYCNRIVNTGKVIFTHFFSSWFWWVGSSRLRELHLLGFACDGNMAEGNEAHLKQAGQEQEEVG